MLTSLGKSQEDWSRTASSAHDRIAMLTHSQQLWLPAQGLHKIRPGGILSQVEGVHRSLSLRRYEQLMVSSARRISFLTNHTLLDSPTPRSVFTSQSWSQQDDKQKQKKTQLGGIRRWERSGGQLSGGSQEVNIPHTQKFIDSTNWIQWVLLFLKKNVFQFIIELLCDPAFLLMGLPEELKSESWKDGNNIIHNSQDMKMFQKFLNRLMNKENVICMYNRADGKKWRKTDAPSTGIQL